MAKSKSMVNRTKPPADWRQQFDLPSLDRLEAISRGEQPLDDPPSPDDTQTAARLQLTFPTIQEPTP